MVRIFDRTVGRDRSTPFANMAFLLTSFAIFAFAFSDLPGRSRNRLILWCPGLKGHSPMAMGQQKDRQGDPSKTNAAWPRVHDLDSAGQEKRSVVAVPLSAANEVRFGSLIDRAFVDFQQTE